MGIVKRNITKNNSTTSIAGLIRFKVMKASRHDLPNPSDPDRGRRRLLAARWLVDRGARLHPGLSRIVARGICCIPEPWLEQAQDDRTIFTTWAMIRPFLRIAGVVFAMVLCVGVARAGSLIEFANVSDEATPPRLLGYLARPDGVGPFPAVVLLHGCRGFFGGIRRSSIS
jgi:hypothetical protein